MTTGTDVAVFVGLQASGKSTFFDRRLSGRYALVSKDLFPRGARNKQRRQMRLVDEHLAAGRPVAVDNTNPSPREWTPLVELAHAHGATATAYWFPPDVTGSLRRNAAREGRARVPDAGVLATLGQLRKPSTEAGFDAVHEVRFDGRGGFEVRAEPLHAPDHRMTRLITEWQGRRPAGRGICGYRSDEFARGPSPPEERPPDGKATRAARGSSQCAPVFVPAT